MAKYYWKGTAAGFTTGVTGASYSAWINATSVGLSANWAYSVGTVGSGVTGATALPGSNDLVYISDRFPTLGTTLSGSTGAGSYTYVLSPCLNSSNVGITASGLYLGPWSNQSVSGLPLIDTFGFSRVGGPTLGNAAISETAGVTAANLVGYPMQCRVTNGIYISDNDLGAYDINLKPAGTTASFILVQRVTPSSGTAVNKFTLAEKPWKSQTALRVDGNVRTLTVNPGVVLGTLRMYSNFYLTPYGTGLTAQAPLQLKGQIFDTELDYSTTSGNVPHVVVDPSIRCFDASAAGKYIFGASIIRTGATDTLSTFAGWGDTILFPAVRAYGLTSGTPLKYTVVLGTHPTEAEPAATTTQKFMTLNQTGLTGYAGEPQIQLRGTVTLKDFTMYSGRLSIDPTSITGQQGLLIQNGYIMNPTPFPADFGGNVRLTPYNDDMVPASGVSALRYTTSYGLYFETGYIEDQQGTTLLYPLDAIFETHTDNPYITG